MIVDIILLVLNLCLLTILLIIAARNFKWFANKLVFILGLLFLFQGVVEVLCSTCGFLSDYIVYMIVLSALSTALILHYSILVSREESWALNAPVKKLFLYAFPLIFSALFYFFNYIQPEHSIFAKVLFSFKFGFWVYLFFILVYAMYIFAFFFSAYMKASGVDQVGRCEFLMVAFYFSFFYSLFQQLISVFFAQTFPSGPMLTFVLIVLLYASAKYKLFRTEFLV